MPPYLLPLPESNLSWFRDQTARDRGSSARLQQKHDAAFLIGYRPPKQGRIFGAGSRPIESLLTLVADALHAAFAVL